MVVYSGHEIESDVGGGKMNRQQCGKCICVQDWAYYPIEKNIISKIPTYEFHKGDIFIFEYMPDENNCWLYHLYKNDKEEQLCNWSFFDKMFEILN